MAGPTGTGRFTPIRRSFAVIGAVTAFSLGIPFGPRLHRDAMEPGGTTALERGDPADAGVPSSPRPAARREVRELRSGSTLGALLEDVLPPVERHGLAEALARHTPPSRLRAGTRVTLEYRTQDGHDGGVAAVEIALDRDRRVRLEPAPATPDGWTTALHEVGTHPDTFYVSGTIDGSLWDAVDRHPVLQGRTAGDRWLVVDGMDRVYQWQIDFSRQLQPGDRFRLAFEAEVRPDGSFREGRVLAAEFVNAGTRFAAAWFDPNGDGRGDYFDETGASVRRAFLKKPLEFRRISSRFNPNRLHPVLGTRRPHRGVDYAAARGTPIMATGDGVVVHRGPKGGLGNAVVLQHANGYRTRYGHMSRVDGSVRSGDRVRQGQVIGYVGSTGLATGPHLHYEMWRDGRVLDPLEVELPSGEPVPDAARDRFADESRMRMALLDRVAGAPVTRVAEGPAAAGAPEDVFSGPHAADRTPPDPSERDRPKQDRP